MSVKIDAGLMSSNTDGYGYSSIRGVRIHYKGISVELKGTAVRINNEDISSFPFHNDAVMVKRATSLFTMVQIIGLTMMYGNGRFYLKVEQLYLEKVSFSLFIYNRDKVFISLYEHHNMCMWFWGYPPFIFY